jgi:hypothetical protein
MTTRDYIDDGEDNDDYSCVCIDDLKGVVRLETVRLEAVERSGISSMKTCMTTRLKTIS